MSDYVNSEYSENIICPYCGEEYEPSYEDTYIGGECIDCYDENNEQICTCDVCNKKFKLFGERTWEYSTETIDGEMTDEEFEEKWEENYYKFRRELIK